MKKIILILLLFVSTPAFSQTLMISLKKGKDASFVNLDTIPNLKCMIINYYKVTVKGNRYNVDYGQVPKTTSGSFIVTVYSTKFVDANHNEIPLDTPGMLLNFLYNHGWKLDFYSHGMSGVEEIFSMVLSRTNK